MAIPATCVWEIRPTNGTANAGGGFDPSVASPGTDYSQQDAVQVAYTDLVIDATTNTDVTSAATPFTSAHVGNNIAVTAGTGFTTGIYNIRSVTSNVARLDRAVGTTGSTGGTGNLGGARSGYTTGTTTLQSSLVAGNTVYVKNEAWNEAVSLTVAGTVSAPIFHIGYDTSRGTTPTGTSRPVNNRASAAGDAITCSAVYNIFRNLRATAAGDAGFSHAANNYFENCHAYSNTNEGWEGSAAIGMINCESSGNGQGLNTGNVRMHGCNIHDNTGVGYDCQFSGPTLTFCIIEGNGSHGFKDNNGGSITNCTVNGNTGASTDGVTAFANGVAPWINNIFSNNGRYGVNNLSGGSYGVFMADYNNFYGNGTAARNGGWPVGANDLALDPQFTDAAGGDFSVGTNMRAAGFPGLFPG